MEPSQNFYDLVQHFEGLKLTAYKDVAGIWTIGYGATHYDNGEAVKEGDTITSAEASRALYDHVKGAFIPAMEQHQYDACLDFIYNVGQGAFNTSTLKKDIVAGTGDITADFCQWDKAHVNGQLVGVPGLFRRRRCEAYLFINGFNHPSFFQS